MLLLRAALLAFDATLRHADAAMPICCYATLPCHVSDMLFSCLLICQPRAAADDIADTPPITPLLSAADSYAMMPCQMPLIRC